MVSSARSAPFLLILPLFLALCMAAFIQPSYAEGAGPVGIFPPPAPIELAQTLPPPNILPTDTTPQIFSGERQYVLRNLQFELRKKLPSRLNFSFVNEASQRLETNDFQTSTHPKRDYVFRELPTVNLGWMVANNTNLYCNYFVIKDVFAVHSSLTRPTTQSLAWGLNHNFQITPKTNLQLDCQARELWQAQGLHQFDMLPNISLTHTVNNNLVLFASTLLQLRGREYFVPATREIDPFYSAGFICHKGLWGLSATTTFVTNYRFHSAIPPHSNVTMISDFEINHPIARKVPYAVAFIRAEPIWNWDSHYFPGLSGFDFRLYSGIRVAFSKPAYYNKVEQLRKQLREEEKGKENQQPQSSPSSELPNNPKVISDASMQGSEASSESR